MRIYVNTNKLKFQESRTFGKGSDTNRGIPLPPYETEKAGPSHKQEKHI